MSALDYGQFLARAHMADLSSKNIRGLERTIADYNPQQSVVIPSWLELAS